MVAAALAGEYPIHVRTGAPNAGHTYYDGEGRKIVARSVPCGAINPEAMLVLGAGALIDLALLIEEISFLDAMGWDVSSRIYVDPRATLVDPIRHHQYEGGVEGDAHKLIGSTGEGVGPARMARIARRTFPADIPWAKVDLVRDSEYAQLAVREGVFKVADTAKLLNDMYDEGSSIFLEGTQGSALSMVHGPWPHTTSTDTNAGQLATDAGLAPSLVNDVIIVARTFPIRVAGPSGPLPKETSWASVGVPSEHTTVTKKERRVGWFHEETVRRSIMLNRPTRMALTFLDYLFPDEKLCDRWDDLGMLARGFVSQAEISLGVPISWVGTGPATLVENTGVDRDRDGRFLRSDIRIPEPKGWPSFLEAYTDTSTPVPS